MVLFDFLEGWLLGMTDLFCIETTRVKPASLGWIDGAGDIPLENDPFLFRGGVRARGGRQQGLGIGVQGALVELIAISELHYFTQIHDGHPVTDVFHNTQVVGYEQVGQVEFFLQILKEINDLGLDRNIECGYGFITDDELGVEGQGPGNTYALTLST